MTPRLSVLQCDITQLDVEGIVNAANERMLGGGGVDGAIHRAAGPGLLEACRALPEVRPGVRCPTGESRITPGFELKARYVIHTVGPVWRGGKHGERESLANCYESSLALAQKHDIRSIAYPAISCGVFGYPLGEAAAVAVATISEFLRTDKSMRQVILAAFSEAVYEALQSAATG